MGLPDHRTPQCSTRCGCPCHTAVLPATTTTAPEQPPPADAREVPCCRQNRLDTRSTLACDATEGSSRLLGRAAAKLPEMMLLGPLPPTNTRTTRQQRGHQSLACHSVPQKPPKADLAVMTVEATSTQASRKTSSTGPRWSSYRTFCRRRICVV